MLYSGMGLSRRRLDVHLLNEAGETCLESWAPPDVDGLRSLGSGVAAFGEPVCGVLESMNGARFGGDHLEQLGWRVDIADAVEVKGLGPLACKTDRIDAWVLGELARRDLVPAIWLPGPEVRADRERARFRLHLVKHRSSLERRVHSSLMAWGEPCPVSDLFGASGRELLARLEVPEPWRTNIAVSLGLLDHLSDQVSTIEAELRRCGADHRYVPILMSAPGIAWVLGYTIAAEIGDIGRFPSPDKLVGYTGLCAGVVQSGERDRRGPLAKNGPEWLRWALMEAATTACQRPPFRDRYQRTKARLGRQRGPRVAQLDVARRLARAIWHMCTRNEAFAPAGASSPLAA